jgi:hypothetical protein
VADDLKEAQRSHIPKEPQITRSLLELQSVVKVKNQILRATRSKECLKNKVLNFQR